MPERKTYVERRCEALSDVLNHAAREQKDYLFGYVANFDFWVSEAVQCLELIDGYPERFAKFRQAIQDSSYDPWAKFDERSGRMPKAGEVEPSTSWNELKAARREVVGAMARFLKRCDKEGLIDENARASAARQVS